MDGLDPIAELDANTNVVSVFVYGSRGFVPDYMIKGGVKYRIISDHVGSVRLVVNMETGAVVQRLDYDAFGRVLQDTSPGFQPFGFQGGIYDRDTGLVHFGVRWYDAIAGRWILKDPIGLTGGWNQYGFCGGDPVNHTDPDGEFSLITVVTVVAVAATFGGLIYWAKHLQEKAQEMRDANRDLVEQGHIMVDVAKDQICEAAPGLTFGQGPDQGIIGKEIVKPFWSYALDSGSRIEDRLPPRRPKSDDPSGLPNLNP